MVIPGPSMFYKYKYHGLSCAVSITGVKWYIPSPYELM